MQEKESIMARHVKLLEKKSVTQRVAELRTALTAGAQCATGMKLHRGVRLLPL